jgi:hypothetical protein
MILFSDALVVASRKWAAVGSQKMVLEHCWGLTDVAIVDVKDSAGEGDVKIRPAKYAFS